MDPCNKSAPLQASRDNLSIASDSVLHGAGPRRHHNSSSTSGQQSMQCLAGSFTELWTDVDPKNEFNIAEIVFEGRMVSNNSKQPRCCGCPFKPDMGELGIIWGLV